MGLDARLFGSNIARRTSVLFYGLRFPHIPYHLCPLGRMSIRPPASYNTFNSSLIQSVEAQRQINNVISNQSNDDVQAVLRGPRTPDRSRPEAVR